MAASGGRSGLLPAIVSHHAHKVIDWGKKRPGRVMDSPGTAPKGGSMRDDSSTPDSDTRPIDGTSVSTWTDTSGLVLRFDHPYDLRIDEWEVVCSPDDARWLRDRLDAFLSTVP